MANGKLTGRQLIDDVARKLEAGEGYTLELVVPVKTLAAEPLAKLQFRRMRGKDWRQIPVDVTKMKYDEILDVAARLTGVAPAVLDEVDSADVPRIGVVVTSFLNGGP